MKILKCLKCGAIVRAIEDCNCKDCGIMCCNEKMTLLKPNTVDAAIEKHKPTFTLEGDEVIVTVNHVMESDHLINWIAIVSDNEEHIINLTAGDKAEVRFKYIPNAKLYAYCNKHGLWETDI